MFGGNIHQFVITNTLCNDPRINLHFSIDKFHINNFIDNPKFNC